MTHKKKLPNIIADALLDESYVVQLVTHAPLGTYEQTLQRRIYLQEDSSEIVKVKVSLWSILKFVSEVHLPLILRISVENPYYNAINRQKKFAKAMSVKLKAKLTELLFCVIFFSDDLRSMKICEKGYCDMTKNSTLSRNWNLLDKRFFLLSFVCCYEYAFASCVVNV